MFLVRMEELPLSTISYQRVREIQAYNRVFQKVQTFEADQEKIALNLCRARLDNGELCMVVRDTWGFTLWCQPTKEQTSRINTFLGPEGIRRLHQGLDIQDRRFRLKTYARCFVGSEAVAWIKKNFTLNEEEALQLGQQLIDQRVFHHVVDDQPFRDGYFFYRFYEDEV